MRQHIEIIGKTSKVKEAKTARGDHPQKLGLFGFYVEPVLGRVWRVAKKRNHAPQQPREGKNAQEKASEILEAVIPPSNAEVPLPDFSDEESGSVPF
ncbi:hypothetical protein [Nitratifractor sp.]|uniref:hypothetical protein n=1 Tax=Nitratifractor sp. TaxID=2268144 RepID=UPI0025E5AF66|nr:hypothetical protein [Nitratifractor sp.]